MCLFGVAFAIFARFLYAEIVSNSHMLHALRHKDPQLHIYVFVNIRLTALFVCVRKWSYCFCGFHMSLANFSNDLLQFDKFYN